MMCLLASSQPLLAPDVDAPVGGAVAEVPHEDIDRDTMTLEEICRRIDISLTVGYELAKKNALPVPAIKAGRQYRFSRRAYNRLMDAQHGDAGTDAA